MQRSNSAASRRPSWQKYALCSGIVLTAILGGFGLLWIGIFGNPLDATWLRLTKRCSGCRFAFSNANFRNADLEGADLNHLNLHGRDFSHANLKRANLSFISSPPDSPAIFRAANLSQANLSNASLPSVDFTNAQLASANLQRADLIYARLESANLENADLTGAQLTGARLLNANFQGANLTNAQLCFLPSLPKLDGAILKGAIVTGADKGFTLAQKQALQKQGAIVGGSSKNCY